MKLFVRAAGMAAAALVLVGGLSYSDPVEASKVDAAQIASIYELHGEATLAAAVAPAQPVVGEAPAAAEPLGEHELATIAATMIGLADSALPGALPKPLDQLVALHAAADIEDPEQHCLAGAVYFEARGEPLEGQLAVAEVVLNRAASGKYPSSICGVVKQPWQFSFVRGGRFPPIDKDCDAWRKAVAIAEIARRNLADKVSSDVLWYHATYVSPSWGRRLNRVTQIGAHIFYS
jgi:spore germination cell wall hydrolase CwlJ-like protein